MLRKHLPELGKTGLKFVAQLLKCLNFNKPCNFKDTFRGFLCQLKSQSTCKR